MGRLKESCCCLVQAARADPGPDQQQGKGEEDARRRLGDPVVVFVRLCG